MQPTNGGLRRGLAVALAVTGAAGATLAALMVPSATAASDPCAASEVARTAGNVAITLGNYLDAHPQTNQALTTISQQQAGAQSLGALKTYFDANPQAAKDIQQLQQPLASLGTRCKLPVSLPQLMGLMQATQQGGATTGGLPAGLPSAQNVGVPSVAVPAQRSPASAVTPGSGPLPGPATAATR
ncbi:MULTISPECIES: hemophore [unclassified Mycolicibacterium]|uniref:hemophore n=1 Tax=unclassified Mycolicibacterium TaxID=2636767 RepID=UPI0012DF5A56|nr:MULTISPECIES: hemophore [unclassified Mycolicibacterium]MUL82721.1 hemophore [Mycolicibacterium sp. CBMA 329]MUL89056.1 hemophore [Mycolicibacterium sp. CBMA 331]MUL97623.1 hemophore [Mycolicibacterium sp. CBMA 334]MUM26334.1 hemophore [Mycolicibacterium sp. CBMA 295]MUM38572.1 hemophore [Mycolicibacterium sp. CBMA 247]